ncbi:RHS repeat-associated core domain-containing protein, partial [Prosthecobacter debontii]
RANSKDEDPTGLLNEGFRYRDIETGMWLSRDPAGFVDGPNLYAYVKQNPWTSFDPEGLYSWAEFKADYSNFIGNAVYGYGQTQLPDDVHKNIPVTADFASRAGRFIGHTTGLVQGVVEMQAGVAAVATGLGGEVFTGGGATPVAIPLIVGGSIVTAHGATVSYNALHVAMTTEQSGELPENKKAAQDLEASQRKNAESNAKAESKESGIYEFPDQKANKPYVGQSEDLASRLNTHKSTGRLKPGTETTTKVAGDKTAREIAEHKRIQEITGGVPASKSDAVANKVDPIGPKRQHLLGEE